MQRNRKCVPLQCVFHSIRFKVNKGWSSAELLFYALMRNASFLLSPKTLIKLHFTVSQIAVLSAISPTSVYQQKSRMKKRIQTLEPELFTDGETLDEWLNEW